MPEEKLCQREHRCVACGAIALHVGHGVRASNGPECPSDYFVRCVICKAQGKEPDPLHWASWREFSRGRNWFVSPQALSMPDGRGVWFEVM
jgi:predicted RNA-binding Zn-ribbon protein involved in translation (DUF1610 family)